jgi:major membrane immunogen (membrane-anchored lipoprotein)
MMTHTQLKQLITEAVLLLALGIALVVGGYFVSSDNANKRMQSLYQTRFEPVMKSASYEKVNSKALNGFPEIKGVYIGYNSTGDAEGYVIDLTVKSLYGKDLSMLVALDYESTRISGLALEPNDDENAFYISQSDMKKISDKLIGKQIPIAFVKEEKKDDKKSDKIIVPGLNDGIYYAQRLYDDRSRYIDYVEMEVKDGIITKVNWDAFSTDKTNQDRSEAALKGAYVVNGLDWATQSYNICHALLECQDPDRLAMKSDGTTDIVKGVTCDIRPFIELTMECIANSRANYDKEKYMIGLNMILLHLFQKDAADLEYLNDDGHIVFSFEKNPEIYTIYNDDNVAVGYMGVMEIEAKIRGITLPNTGDGTNTQTGNNDDNTGTGVIEYDGTEDGLSSGSSTDDQIFTESLDDLPMTEMASFIEPLSDRYDQTRTVVKACNTCYKFLKEYLNWKVT